MRTKILISVIVLLIGIFVLPAQASITSVAVQPEIPTINDDISLLISGVESGSMEIVDTSLIINEMLLELDIYIRYGMLPVVTPWSHSENIGMLPIGTYDLTVSMFVESRPDLDDTFTTSFEVVPEPGTMILLGLGGLLIRKN